MNVWSGFHPRDAFARFARISACAFGSWQAFAVAAALVLAWIIGGFYYGFTNELYQLLLNSVTTAVTFLMVFLIQGSVNRDTTQMNLKLDAIIAALPHAPNRMIGLEDLSEAALRRLKEDYNRLAAIEHTGTIV